MWSVSKPAPSSAYWTRERCSGAASGKTNRSENGPASGSPWRSRAMPWLSSRPSGWSRPASVRQYASMLTVADVLDHADRGDRVERLAAHVAVVGDADVDAVGHARLLRPLPRAGGLRLGERDAGDVDAVRLRGVDGERAPAAADVEHAVALLEAELGADELVLGRLGLLERLGPAAPVRARVRHRRPEEQLEELVGDVVVVRDRALVAGDRVALALRAQLDGGGVRDALERAGADGRGGDLRLGLRVDGRRRVVREQLQRLVDVVDAEVPGHVRAAEAELAGRAQHVAERDGRADGEDGDVAVRRGRQLAPVPQFDAERALRQRLGQDVAQRLRTQAASAYFLACFSRGIRTTSQARPAFSSPQMTHADGSSSQRRMPCSADVGNA